MKNKLNFLTSFLLILGGLLNAQYDTILEIGSLGPNKGLCTFITPDTAYGISGLYDLQQSIDSGKTWKKVKSLSFGGAYSFNSMGVANSKRVIGGLNSGGRTYLTEDAGQTWNQILIGRNQRVASIHFLDSMNVFAVLNGNTGSVDTPYVYKSIDGGNSWSYHSKVMHKTSNTKLIFAKDAPNIVYMPISGDDSLLLKSVDSAKTWMEIKLPFNIHSSNKLYAFSDTSIYAYGGYDQLYYTNNGGQTWTAKFKVPNSYDATDFLFPSPSEGYMLSYYSNQYDARLHRILDFGNTHYIFAVEPNSWAVYFGNSDTTHLKFHGNNGRIFELKKGGFSGSTIVADVSGNNVTVYPNPATGVINFSGVTKGAVVEVLNIQGQVVLSEIINNGAAGGGNVSIDINDLQAGSYLLKVTNGTKITSTKFIRQ